jgi:hypothetical protein
MRRLGRPWSGAGLLKAHRDSFTEFANFGGRLHLFLCHFDETLPRKWRRHMDQQSKGFRAALVGATAALSILSAIFVAACGAKQPHDFPAMRLTSAPTTDAEPRR